MTTILFTIIAINFILIINKTYNTNPTRCSRKIDGEQQQRGKEYKDHTHWNYKNLIEQKSKGNGTQQTSVIIDILESKIKILSNVLTPRGEQLLREGRQRSADVNGTSGHSTFRKTVPVWKYKWEKNVRNKKSHHRYWGGKRKWVFFSWEELQAVTLK